jgi:protein required for attachment to host cells
MKKIRTWILVADGARARILSNEGAGGRLLPVPGHEFEADHPPTREIGADRPGRVHANSRDSARHSMNNTVDWHRFAKEDFAREMAKLLNRAAARKAFERLVLVAPAKTLGDLRKALDETARGQVSHEISKDLTPLPLKELTENLGSALVF